MAAGQESWRARPGTVALVRSIAASARADQRLRELRIGELLARHASPASSMLERAREGTVSDLGDPARSVSRVAQPRLERV